ncbi:MAG: helix-turn-helix domain-containing protein [Spiribacter salinus]|uniref:Helix-turn-helix domain-containing protein n=1 Tax=Spiribacter salinus TaxID=1335746 RepID=A0A540VP22_9GAMM|nr:MAG: helix-turn-helix domain-containing protein [Spiribacter salinus]
MNEQVHTNAFAPGRERVRQKWGTAVDEGFTGFQMVPDVLVRSQKRLGLTSAEMMVLLNILMHWWTADRWPHPRLATIARRMGVEERTVQRHVGKLEKVGLVKRLPPEQDPGGGPSRRRFDLTGLIARLEELADQMRLSEGEDRPVSSSGSR